MADIPDIDLFKNSFENFTSTFFNQYLKLSQTSSNIYNTKYDITYKCFKNRDDRDDRDDKVIMYSEPLYNGVLKSIPPQSICSKKICKFDINNLWEV